jgi:type II secretory pathway predicted ATPase ExeA
MMPAYRTFFGFTREPFGADLHSEDILQTPEVLAVSDRFHYAVRLGAMALVTGDVGCGKSTALRWTTSRLHPSQYRTLWVTASSGSILELYRLICSEFEVHTNSYSRAALIRIIRQQILETTSRKLQCVLIIDEASLLRIEVFAELHTITQFQADSQPIFPIILAGQNSLAEMLLYRTSLPLASRIVTRSHLHGIAHADMELYLNHHLKIAGVAHPLFHEAAVTAIHQGSGGLLRRANHLARGALIAAANEKSQQVCAEHVRIASTELL